MPSSTSSSPPVGGGGGGGGGGSGGGGAGGGGVSGTGSAHAEAMPTIITRHSARTRMRLNFFIVFLLNFVVDLFSLRRIAQLDHLISLSLLTAILNYRMYTLVYMLFPKMSKYINII